MNTKEMNQQILESLNWRYGTKAFDPSKKISESDWDVLKETLRLAPSSFGLQPWQFIEVKSPDILKKFAEAAPLNKGKFETASNIVILARLKSISPTYLEKYYSQFSSDKGLPREKMKMFEDMVSGTMAKRTPEQQAAWSALQTYIPLGAFLAAAALLKIDACAMEGIDPGKFDEILGLDKTEYGSLVGLAAGYRSQSDQTQFTKKVRHAPTAVFRVV